MQKGGFRCRSSKIAAISWPALSVAGGRGRAWRQEHRSPTRGRRRRPRSVFSRNPASASRPDDGRGAGACRGLHRRPLCRVRGRQHGRADGHERQDRYCHGLRGRARSANWMPAPQSPCWRACIQAATSCLRISPSTPSSDLKGRSVAIPQRTDYGPRLSLSIMTAYIGLDPRKDINWVTSSTPNPMELFAAGKMDAFFGSPPDATGAARPQDRPSDSQDRHRSALVAVFLLHAGGRRDYVHSNPVATKRVIRAILKATDMCAAEPERAARRLVEAGYGPLRLRAGDDERPAVRQVARVQPGGHDTLLRVAPA